MGAYACTATISASSAPGADTGRGHSCCDITVLRHMPHSKLFFKMLGPPVCLQVGEQRACEVHHDAMPDWASCLHPHHTLQDGANCWHTECMHLVLGRKQHGTRHA